MIIKQKAKLGKNKPVIQEQGRRAELARIYDIYKAWKTIPPLMRGQDSEVIKRLGIEEKEVAELMQIRSQTEFSEKYGVSQEALSDWNKLLLKDEDVIDTKKWFKKLTRNVISSLYRKALIEGDAPRVKLWFQYMEDWKESLGVEHSGEMTHTLSAERKKKLDEILERSKKTK